MSINPRYVRNATRLTPAILRADRHKHLITAVCLVSFVGSLAGCGGDTGDLVQPPIPGGSGGTAQIGNVPPNHVPFVALSITTPGPYAPDGVVELDASLSSDSDGDALTMSWSQVSGPEAALSSLSGPSSTVRLPRVVDPANLLFRVTVSDGRGGVATADAGVAMQVAAQFAGHPQSALPYRAQLTTDEAYHLLRRAAFGATPDQVATAVARGLSATLDDLFAFHVTPDSIETQAATYTTDIHRRWMYHMVEGPNPLREQMALFWHDRFAASQRVLAVVNWPLAIEHFNLLRNDCLGNYRQFLKDLTSNRMMLFWLDGANSAIEHPNENYAREFWELFTLGRDVVYTESDVRLAARAFTGFHMTWFDNDPAIIPYLPEFHDPGIMNIFPGRAAPRNYDYRDIVDLTLAQPEASRYVARNLFTYFIHDHPSDSVIQDLADLFVASNYEIEPLVRRIFSCQAFFSEEARGSLMTSPVEYWVGICRTLDMHIDSAESRGQTLMNVAWWVDSAGQRLLNPQTVFGWEEGLGWINERGILDRIRVLCERMEFGPSRTSTLPFHLLPPESEWYSPDGRERIVDSIASVFHLDMTTEERQIYVDMINYLELERISDVIKLMAIDERVVTR